MGKGFCLPLLSFYWRNGNLKIAQYTDKQTRIKKIKVYRLLNSWSQYLHSGNFFAAFIHHLFNWWVW